MVRWIALGTWIGSIYGMSLCGHAVREYLKTIGFAQWGGWATGVFVLLALALLARLLGPLLKSPQFWKSWECIVFCLGLTWGMWMARHYVVERIHIPLFGGLGFLVFAFVGWRRWSAILFLLLVSWSDEQLQDWLPHRYFDYRDIALNFISALLGWNLARKVSALRAIETPPHAGH